MATILHEPEVTDVDRLAAELRQLHAGPGDLMLGLGGGAAIDLAKASAAMAVEQQSPTVKDYLENVGRDLKILGDPLPVLAMPTTAGTGTEATRNAVISCYDPPVQEEPARHADPAADRAGGPGAHRERSGRGDRGQRHGRHHPTAGELHLAQGAARFPRPWPATA